MVVCYWLEALDRAALYMRRYVRDGHGQCPGGHGYHDAAQYIGRMAVKRDEDDPKYVGYESYPAARPDVPARDDSRWPRVCAAGCGYAFTESDEWQLLQRRLYAPIGSTDLRPLEDWGPGALYDARWYPDAWRGPDGIALVARCPNGMDWPVDGEATGGGRWRRTGNPREPATLTITPSIAIGTPGEPGYYHGFLGHGGAPPGTFTAHIG
jgi:hypothetical protein